MKRNRIQTWLALGVVGVGLLGVALAGMFVFMSATAETLHPQANEIPSSVASPPSADWMPAVDRARAAVRAHLTEWNLPGMSVAVGAEGRLVWAEGFGWADLDQRTVVEPGTRFRIGTASIVLTSAGVALLAEQNRLNLDAPIQTYVSEFPQQAWPVTVRQLLSHTAGVREDGGDEGPLLGRRCDRLADAVSFVGEYPLLFEPGTQYRFSSYGWIVVSRAIEAVAGESLSAFMRREVFAPLGMADTREESAEAPVAGRPTFYFPRFAADPRYGLHEMRPLDYSCYAGAGVFLSTASDLVRFGLAMTGGTLVTPETVRTFQTSAQLPSGEMTGYGLGWDLEAIDLNGARVPWAGHVGDSLGGDVATLLTMPDQGLVVAVSSNISYAQTEALAVAIARALRAGR